MRGEPHPLPGDAETLQLLVASVKDYAIFLLDPQGYIRTWNPGAERAKGYKAEEVIGKHFSIFYPQEAIDRDHPAWELKAAAAEGRFEEEGWRKRKDGTVFWANVVITALRDERGVLQGFGKVTRDLTERKRAEDELRSANEQLEERVRTRTAELIQLQERYERAARAGRVGVWDWQVGAEELFLSADLKSILGYADSELPNTTAAWRELLHPDDRERVDAAAQAYLEGASPRYEVEARRRHRNGEYFWFLARGELLRDAEGAPLRLTGSDTDITERRRLQDELQSRAEALAEADRRKDRFLAMLGHELRNPLSAAINTLQLLRTSKGDAARVTRLQSVLERQTGALKRLVDDLLDVSRVTQGKVVLRKERVTLTHVVRNAVEMTRASMDHRGHQLSVSLPLDPILLDADPTRLEQILVNLLNNAAKYTEPGGRIWLTAEAEMEPSGETPQLLLTVRDTGIGIAPELLPQVWEIFTQADRSLDRAEGGLGLGLTLVRELVLMHGGTVTAHSEGPGQGSSFQIRLPILPEGSAPPAPARPAPPPARPARILVVEDNRDAGETLAELLELSHHTVRLEHTGEAALQQAALFHPDVVLCDIGLPGMDGYEVARRLRQDLGLRDALLIALTGYGQETHRRAALDAGFDHHLTKPLDFHDLQELLSEARSSSAVAGSAVPDSAGE